MGQVTKQSFCQQWDSIHEAAVEATGFSDFGDTDYQQGLDLLLQALDDQPELSDAEAASAHELISYALEGRLFAQAGWTQHPDVFDTPIHRPVIVTGMPRTGTTALHQLLNTDPQFQGIECWLTYAPMVRPPRQTWQTNPHYQATTALLAARHAAAPEAMDSHSVGADEVDECLLPMAQSFVSNMYPSMLDIPGYDDWFRKQDQTDTYRRYARLLHLIGAGDERRWLLKNPSHLFGIDALLKVFPDALIVQTHRHPATCIASVTSVISGMRAMLAPRPVDRDAVQQREIKFWAEAARRGMAAHDRHPDRFVDVRQADIQNDPIGTVTRIYDHFGLTLSDDAQAAMNTWSAQNRPRPEGHAYEPVRSNDAIADAFGGYLDRYGYQ
jgi:hypothetical protein